MEAFIATFGGGVLVAAVSALGFLAYRQPVLAMRMIEGVYIALIAVCGLLMTWTIAHGAATVSAISAAPGFGEPIQKAVRTTQVPIGLWISLGIFAFCLVALYVVAHAVKKHGGANTDR